MSESRANWSPELVFVLLQKSLGVWFLASGILDLWGSIWTAMLVSGANAKLTLFGDMVATTKAENRVALTILLPLGSIAVGWWLARRPFALPRFGDAMVPPAPWEKPAA